MDKHWFLVNDSKTKTDSMLAMLPWNAQCILPFTKLTRKTLSDLAALLKVQLYRKCFILVRVALGLFDMSLLAEETDIVSKLTIFYPLPNTLKLLASISKYSRSRCSLTDST